MGMYTEFVFEGETIIQLPKAIEPYFNYFFTQDTDSEVLLEKDSLPDNSFFKLPNWDRIGHISSYYFIPFAVRQRVPSNNRSSSYVFMRCDLKNYNSEIQLFLDWIWPYMQDCRGYYWYEENDHPVVFKK